MNQSAWFGITPHDIVVIVLAIVITALLTRGWRRLGLGFGKYWLARGQTAAYYASAPMSVLVPFIGARICLMIASATTLLIVGLGILMRHPTDTFVRYFSLAAFGVLLFSMFESHMRIMEVGWRATEMWQRDEASPQSSAQTK